MPTRRGAWSVGLAWLFTFLGLFITEASEGAAPRNVLLVIADDYGFDGHELYNTNSGASIPPTPTITALARRGIRFANAYAYPTCSPSRAALLTGRYGFRTGVTQVIASAAEQGLYTNEVTLPDLLSPTYRCASFGKWNLGGDASGPKLLGGWSSFSGSLPAVLGQTASSFYTWTKTSNGVTRANYSGYATTDNVNDALTWTKSQGTNRWFAWIAFNAPHSPHHLPPTNLCPHYAHLSGSAADLQRNPRSYFEASVEAMDTELGRMIAGIDTNDTTIVFIGDNGTVPRLIQPPYTRAGRAKDTLYEGGVRVPFIVAGPGVVQPGRTSDAVVHVVDLFATLLELGGVTPSQALPQGLVNDSRSLVSILENRPFQPEQLAVLIEDTSPTPTGSSTGRAARQGRYKLLELDSEPDELYDLEADPLEGTNLLSRVLSAEEQRNLDELRAKLAGWRNIPRIQDPVVVGGHLQLDVGWFAEASFTLWRTVNPDRPDWVKVTSAEALALGPTIRLVDTSPLASGAFYQVRQP